MKYTKTLILFCAVSCVAALALVHNDPPATVNDELQNRINEIEDACFPMQIGRKTLETLAITEQSAAEMKAICEAEKKKPMKVITFQVTE